MSDHTDLVVRVLVRVCECNPSPVQLVALLVVDKRKVKLILPCMHKHTRERQQRMHEGGSAAISSIVTSAMQSHANHSSAQRRDSAHAFTRSDMQKPCPTKGLLGRGGKCIGDGMHMYGGPIRTFRLSVLASKTCTSNFSVSNCSVFSRTLKKKRWSHVQDTVFCAPQQHRANTHVARAPHQMDARSREHRHYKANENVQPLKPKRAHIAKHDAFPGGRRRCVYMRLSVRVKQANGIVLTHGGRMRARSCWVGHRH